MPSYQRRLPIYLLLDCSESMAGEAFTALDRGLASMLGILRSDPMALETAYLSVISFASAAKQLTPLTDICKFQQPKLLMGSGTALGAALELWQQCMKRELARSTPDQKGDWKPLCFILTDGAPTDEWETAAETVRTSIVGKKANVIAVALGPDADINKLRRITETVLILTDVGPEAFKQFFKWVSASVSAVSQKMEAAVGEGLALPNLPQELKVAEARRGSPPDGRFVFLHCRCVKRGGFYLLRFEKTSGSGASALYKGVAAYPLDAFEEEESAEEEVESQISGNQLTEPSACPYCGNGLWARCTRGHIHCCPMYDGDVTLTCPWCQVTATYGSGNFDLNTGRG